MKLTKQKLQQIIKEEVNKIMKEGEDFPARHRRELKPGEHWAYHRGDGSWYVKQRDPRKSKPKPESPYEAEQRAYDERRRAEVEADDLARAGTDIDAAADRRAYSEEMWPEAVKDPMWRSMVGIPQHFTDEEAVGRLERYGEDPDKSYKLKAPKEREKRQYPHLDDGRFDKLFPPEKPWYKKLLGIQENGKQTK